MNEPKAMVQAQPRALAPASGSRLSLVRSVRTPTFAELRMDGEALRWRLVDLHVSVEEVEALVQDIRAWQVRCSSVVAARGPMLVADFRVQAGPIQRQLGDGWMPTPGWQRRLDDSVGDWLRALERVNRLGMAGRRRASGRPGG